MVLLPIRLAAGLVVFFESNLRSKLPERLPTEPDIVRSDKTVLTACLSAHSSLTPRVDVVRTLSGHRLAVSLCICPERGVEGVVVRDSFELVARATARKSRKRMSSEPAGHSVELDEQPEVSRIALFGKSVESVESFLASYCRPNRGLKC